jgi:O-antigen/teichoic acid export membrane protein
LQLAEGWVRLPLIQSTIAVIFVIPASVWAANRYGGPGAASLWALLNAVFVVTSVAIMHRRLLRGERATWCLRDVGLPLIASLAVAVPARLLVAPRSGQLPALAWLAAIGLLTLTAAAFATPYIRVLMSEALSYVRRRA